MLQRLNSNQNQPDDTNGGLNRRHWRLERYSSKNTRDKSAHQHHTRHIRDWSSAERSPKQSSANDSVIDSSVVYNRRNQLLLGRGEGLAIRQLPAGSSE